MSVLVWWVLPAATAFVAVAWATWVRREPRDEGDVETVEAYARFRAALARSSTSRNTGPPSGV